MELVNYRITLDTLKNGVQKTLQGFNTGDAYARRIEISLVKGSSLYELSENIVATMYVQHESATQPSINACEVVGNKVIYNIMPSDISTEGIVSMQLKIIEVRDGIDKILVTPKFELCVWESISDGSVSTEPAFTALEEALAEAKRFSDKTVTSVVVDEDYLFIVTYADGTQYISTVIQDAMSQLRDVSEYVGRAELAATSAELSKAGAAESEANALNSAAEAHRDKQYIIDHREELMGEPGVVFRETEPTLPEERVPIWINPAGEFVPIPTGGGGGGSDIDDNVISASTTYSSQKIENKFISQVKTINGQSIKGTGNIVIEGGSGGGEDYKKRILNFPLRLKDMAKVQSGLFTYKTRYVSETETAIVNPVVEPAVISGEVNPKLLHVIGNRTYRVVQDAEGAWYLKNDNGFTNGGGTLDLAFGFDGDKFEMFISSYTHIRVYVDDGSGMVVHSDEEQYILKGSYGRLRNVALTLDFGSAKPRNIIIECGIGDLFGGFIHSREYSVYPFAEKRPLAMFIGSSLTDGSALGVGQQNTWNKYVCRRLGLEWVNLGQGATGFLNKADHLEGRDKVRGRMHLVYPHHPWLLTLEGSYNDMGGGHSVQELKNELDILFAEVNENIPECLSVVIGTLTPCRDKKSDGYWDAKNDALREKALEYNMPFIDVLNGKVYSSRGEIISESESWLYGSGNTSDVQGDGNCDIYIGSDAVHPNAKGHRYLGDRILNAIVSIISAERVNGEIPANNFNLDKNMLTLNIGDSKQLTYFPTDAMPTFESFGDAVSVTASGMVSVLSGGVAIIKATYNGVTDTCIINVDESVPIGAVTSISATKTKVTYEEGDTLNTDDIEVTATYESGISLAVSGWTTNAASIDMATEGSKTLTITYTEDGVTVTCDIAITVSAEPAPEPTGYTLPDALKTTDWWFVYENNKTGNWYCGNASKSITRAFIATSTQLLTMYATSGAKINGWKSTDQGQSWTQTCSNVTTYGTLKTANGNDTYNFDTLYGDIPLWKETSGNFELAI